MARARPGARNHDHRGTGGVRSDFALLAVVPARRAACGRATQRPACQRVAVLVSWRHDGRAAQLLCARVVGPARRLALGRAARVYRSTTHQPPFLRNFCKNEHGFSAYHALFYGGAVLGIWVVQRGEVVKFVDLYAYITARLGRSESVPLSRKVAVKRMLAAEYDEEQDDDGDLLCRRIKLGYSWDEVAARLPALKEPRLAPGERCSIKNRKKRPGVPVYRRKGGVLFGSVDVEAGERIEPPFKIRGWDPLAEDDEDD